MGERDTVFAIYKYLTNDGLEGEQGEPSYYLIRVFDNTGRVDDETLFSLFHDAYPEIPVMEGAKYVGPFPNLTVVNKFSFGLCEELDADRICLLSVLDYNSIIDNTSNVSELSSKMLEVGSVIENIEKEERGKGLLNKFFR